MHAREKSLRQRRDMALQIFFSYLLILMCYHGNGMVNGNQMHAHQSSHMDHMDIGFFTMDDIYVGNIFSITFPFKDPSSSPHFLPREEADSIPFSLSKLLHLLQLFSIPQGSPQAKAMEDTLAQCEIEPIKGETKFCATSLESMLDFARGAFGFGAEFQVLTTTHSTVSNDLSPNYTILEAKEILAPKMFACHSMPYPYAIYYCHYQESETKAFKVSLGGDNGDKVEAVAACHMDTSEWSPDHISLHLLKVKPGACPVCHFFPPGHLVWVQ